MTSSSSYTHVDQHVDTITTIESINAHEHAYLSTILDQELLHYFVGFLYNVYIHFTACVRMHFVSIHIFSHLIFLHFSSNRPCWLLASFVVNVDNCHLRLFPLRSYANRTRAATVASERRRGEGGRRRGGGEMDQENEDASWHHLIVHLSIRASAWAEIAAARRLTRRASRLHGRAAHRRMRATRT